MTYTFSKREKILIMCLAIIIVLMAWYVLVFQGTNNQISKIEGQISDSQTTLSTETAKLASMKNMQSVIDDAKAHGITPSPTPLYDNIRTAMGELDRALANTENYAIGFDPVSTGPSGSTVSRVAHLSFGCASFGDVRSVVSTLNNSTLPCSISSLNMSYSDGETNATGVAAGSSGTARSTTSAVHVEMTVTFFEKMP